MSDRTGETWRLSNLDGKGFVLFVVLRSERHGLTEIEHDILVLETERTMRLNESYLAERERNGHRVT
jgi:hypothetical protein